MKLNKALRVGVCLVVLLALLCAPACAKVVSPGSDFYYLDNANVLSESLEGEIFFSNQLLQDACGAQVVVVTLDSTGSERIDDYAYDLFNKWGIGDGDRNNGFLILLAIDDEDYYALPGSGLDSRFSAGTIKSYYDEYLETDFAAGRYEAGVKKLFEAVFARIADTYSANVTTAQGIAAYENYISADSGTENSYGGYVPTGRRGGSGGSGGSAMAGLVLVLIIVLIVVLAKRSSRRRIVRRSTMTEDVATMYMADRMLRNARGVVRSPRIPTRTSPGYRPFSFSAGSHSSGPSARSSGGGFFGGGSSSFRSSGGSSHSSGGSSFRSSGGGFGGARSGGGGSRGGGAGRGRH